MRRIPALLTLAVLTLPLPFAPAEAGPFQDYIARAETKAAWKEVSSVEKDGIIEARLSLTSHANRASIPRRTTRHKPHTPRPKKLWFEPGWL